jgi:hypothetical protein
MAQVGALVLLAAAFAAYAFLPVVGKIEAISTEPGGTGGGEQDRSGPPTDFQKVAAGLAWFDTKKVVPKPPDGADAGEAGNAPKEGAGPEWKYLGAIVEPTRLVAIVEADGSQHLMTPGSTYTGKEGGEVRVLEVGGEAIVVADGSGRRTIELVKKEGAVLGMGSVADTENAEGAGHDGEADPDMIGPRAMDRRGTGPKRPATLPGARNIPRPPRPTPGGSSGRPQHPPIPDGN